MRILIVSAVLVATASCAWPPPPPAEVTGSAPPHAASVFYAPNPFAFLFAPILPTAPPPGGRLTLNNFSYDHARVQTVITPYPDCVVREGTAPGDFELPLNGTRVIEAAPGTDVCWRRQVEPPSESETEAPPPAPAWTEWNRVYTAFGRSIDTRL